MSCELPDRFAAVVPVAAGYRALDPCPANARFDFLDIHGTADTVVPYNGKKPDRKGSVPRYTSRVAAARRLLGQGGVARRSKLVTKTVYRGCDDGLRVEALKLTGTDHGWPGNKGGRLRAQQPVGAQGDDRADPLRPFVAPSLTRTKFAQGQHRRSRPLPRTRRARASPPSARARSAQRLGGLRRRAGLGVRGLDEQRAGLAVGLEVDARDEPSPSRNGST